MKRIHGKGNAACTGIALVMRVGWGVGLVCAQRLETPPLVRFVGTLLQANAEPQKDAQSLTLIVQKQRCILHIAEVERLAGRGSGRPVLKELPQRRLSVHGPKELLGTLSACETTGQPVTFEGHLYDGTHRLILTAVQLIDSPPEGADAASTGEEQTEKPQPAMPAGIL